MLSRFEQHEGRMVRRYYPLTLERRKVVFFPLSWTIVHPIDDGSPLWGKGEQDLRMSSAEILILLTGIDETFSQPVHSRSSYTTDEVVWHARFADIFDRSEGQEVRVDIGRLDEIVRLV